jgi:hypothetical protein
LKVGDVIGVYCGGTGDVDHTFFWLAKVQAKSRADAAIADSPALFKAAVRDEGWDIEASEFILNIQWLKRMGRAKWWGLAGEQIITLTSVLPVCARGVEEQQRCGRTGPLPARSARPACGVYKTRRL